MTALQQKMENRIDQIWETGDVSDANERCEKIVAECNFWIQDRDYVAGMEDDDDAAREADVWRQLRRKAVAEFNAHVPVFANG